MDKYEIKIDNENNRIIITDEDGLNVASQYDENKIENVPLCLLTDPRDIFFIQAWNEYGRRKKEISEIKVGDWVKIVDDGKMYCTYIEWFKKNASFDVAARYAYDSYENDDLDGTYYVICKAPHSDWNDVELCAISKSSYDKVYLIDVRGLEKVID